MLQFLNVLQDPVEIELAEAQSRDLCGGNDLCFPWYTMLLVPGSRLLLRDHKSFYLLLHFVKVSRNLGALNLRGERERESKKRAKVILKRSQARKECVRERERDREVAPHLARLATALPIGAVVFDGQQFHV